MRYSPLSLVALYFVLSLDSTVYSDLSNQNDSQPQVDFYMKRLFDKTSPENIKPEIFKEWLLYVNKALKSGKATDKNHQRKSVVALAALIQFTTCTQQNLDRFQETIDENLEHHNLVAFIKWQKEIYMKTCIELEYYDQPRRGNTGGQLENLNKVQSLVDYYLRYLFDKGSRESIAPQLFKEWLLYVKGALKGFHATHNDKWRPLVFALVELTQLTRCTQQNLDKFQKIIVRNPGYNNLLTFVEWQRDIYKSTCTE